MNQNIAVLGVILFSTIAGSKASVSGQTSTKTGVNPSCFIGKELLAKEVPAKELRHLEQANYPLRCHGLVTRPAIDLRRTRIYHHTVFAPTYSAKVFSKVLTFRP